MQNRAGTTRYVPLHRAAEFIGRSKTTIYRWREEKRLETLTVDGVTFVSTSSLNDAASSAKRGRPRRAA
jgi:hypothetical protein